MAIKAASELDELLALVNSDEEEGFCEPLSETEAKLDSIA